MIIDCCADLHGNYPKLEGGDLLIVAGDLTRDDNISSIIEFKNWIMGLSKTYKKIVCIAGNHDNWIEEMYMMNSDKYSWDNSLIAYLQDSGTEFEGLKIWGSPWTKSFPGMNPKCKAFTVETDEELAEKWALIPEDTEILVTHSPPLGAKDYTTFQNGKLIMGYGSSSLGKMIGKIKPRLHVFGHIHEAYGTDQNSTTKFVNASHVNEFYEPVNKPIRIKL